jgi:NAD(P)-dependent dehydrogenase (short-subunit alcohol dehydrogenase family)
MKTIFITSASSGLGKATGKPFAASVWNVLATMRHPDAETELTQLPNVHVLSLDVINLAQIEAMVKQAQELYSIAAVVYEAATDQKNQLRYQAGDDTTAIYAQRLAAGPEAFRQGVAAQFA